MKKTFIALIALLLVSVAGLAACGNGKNTENQGYYTVSDFETEREYFAMNWKNSFGIVKVNSDERFVKSGENSARLEIHGDPFSGSGYTPYLIIYTGNEFNEKTDYSDVSAFEFSFYNDSGRDVTVKFQFLSKAVYKGGLSSEYGFSLKSGEWTDCKVEIDRGFIGNFMDLGAISEFYFKFENRQKDETPAVLYLDRFVAKTTDEPIKQTGDIRKPNEIESAEKAEYLSAWSVTPNRGGSLSYNTDPKYVREGTASFRFTASPTGGVNWPEIVLKSNMLTDLTPYDSIYFWWYNDGREAVDIVTAGGTKMSTVKPGEWTLVDMKVSWIANVPTFDGLGKNYDIRNFNNFTISFTNNNGSFDFYFDGFYARKEGEGYIGADEEGKPLQLSQDGVIKAEAGSEFIVPQVLNADDYEQITHTISATGMAGPDLMYIEDERLENAEKFTPNPHTGYLIRYKAVDKDGRVSKASVTVIDGGEDGFDMRYGTDETLKTFTATQVSGDYAEMTATLNTDKKYTLYGDNSVKLTIPASETARPAGVCWSPGFNVDTFDYLMFSFYNDGDASITLISMWGLVIHLDPGQWIIRSTPNAQIRDAANGAPEVHDADEFSISFLTPSSVFAKDVDIYFEFSTFGHNDVPPLVKLPKTSDVVERGATVTVPVSSSAGVTWKVFCNGAEMAGSENAPSFKADNFGVYTVKYSRTVDGLTGTNTYSVYVVDPETIVTPEIEDTEKDPTRDEPNREMDGMKFFGTDTLRVTGTKAGPDAAFYWNTGVTNDLNSLSIFIYNNSDGVVNFIYAYGAVISLQQNAWSVVTMTGDQMTEYAKGWPISEVGRVNNEWLLLLHMNVSRCNEYDLTFAFTMDKGEEPSPEFGLDTTEDTVEINEEYVVPAIDGATWEVYYRTYKQGIPSTFSADKVIDGVTEKGFTPKKEGIYEVRYDKDGDTATLIVLAADPETIVTPSTEKMEEDSLRDHPTFALDGGKIPRKRHFKTYGGYVKSRRGSLLEYGSKRRPRSYDHIRT